ncbi:MAG: hypothetical protein RLY95_1645 [Pseudomonadota bacterium]
MRSIQTSLHQDLKRKMVLLTGPRQVGKTTLAKQLGRQFKNPILLNYDVAEHAAVIESRAWLPSSDYLVLDELHKMTQWKAYLKGVVDSKPVQQGLLVTGSARLDTFRQAGESLAGRYFQYHLMPFSVKEWVDAQGATPVQALDHLMRFSGFPEPCCAGNDADRLRWQNQYYSDLLREDILEFGRIHELRAMRLLLEMLRSRTGSPLSYQSLARDLDVSPKTVQKYVDILVALHIVFLVAPYHRNIARALSKAPKLYFYDWAYVKGDAGAIFENLIATSLLKHTHFLADTTGQVQTLHFVQTTSGKEIDFVLANSEGDLEQAIEVKWADSKPVYALREILELHPNAKAIQLVYQLGTPYVPDPANPRLEVHPAAQWLNQLSA